MLVILASVTPSLSLSHAESRVGSEARSRFCAAVSSPSAKAFELALLMAAEERPTEDVASISCEVDAIVNALADKARSRLQLQTLVGGDPEDPFNLARHVLGYGRKLGGIRIGQLRTRRRNCTSQIGIPELITKTPEPFFCYGDALSKFTENHEDNATFGRGHKQFTWVGWNNSDTHTERGAFLTFELLKPR